MIAGKSMPTEGSPKCFGFVQTYDTKPKRRLFEVLKSQGMLGPEQRKLLNTVTEFGGYIRANGAWIPNYGERYRCGETISSAFRRVDRQSSAKQADGQKQQMRWTPEGAHLLLQTRTRTLNGELAATFRVRYPAFASEDLELLDEPPAAP